MKLNSKYTMLWIAWILGFLGIEYAAMKNKRRGDTLTEHVWATIGTKTKGKTAAMWIARIGLGGLLLWLIPHFFTGAV
jgi:hypothetical protein